MADKFRVDIPWGTAGSSPSAKYCNSVAILFSPWEFNFEFSQLVPVLVAPPTEAGGAPGDVQISKQIHEFLAMSPQHAKALLRALAENVSKYEEQFGEIPDLSGIAQPPTNG